MIISDSTVAAVSTPRAAGGISVIRISGDNAFEIADRIFTPLSSKKKPSEMEGYTCAYGKIHTSDGDELDVPVGETALQLVVLSDLLGHGRRSYHNFQSAKVIHR